MGFGQIFEELNEPREEGPATPCVYSRLRSIPAAVGDVPSSPLVPRSAARWGREGGPQRPGRVPGLCQTDATRCRSQSDERRAGEGKARKLQKRPRRPGSTHPPSDCPSRTGVMVETRRRAGLGQEVLCARARSTRATAPRPPWSRPPGPASSHAFHLWPRWLRGHQDPRPLLALHGHPAQVVLQGGLSGCRHLDGFSATEKAWVGGWLPGDTGPAS